MEIPADPGPRRLAVAPAAIVLGPGEPVGLVATAEGPRVVVEAGLERRAWKVVGDAFVPVEAATPSPPFASRAGGRWEVAGAPLLPSCPSGGPAPVPVREGGVMIDPCGDRLLRWSAGWSAEWTGGDLGAARWVVADAASVGVVDGAPPALRWRSWTVDRLVPVAPAEVALPAGARRVVARGRVTGPLPAPSADVSVRLPDGLEVVDVGLTEAGLTIVGRLRWDGGPQAAVLRVAPP